MESEVQIGTVLMLIAAVVAMLCRRLRLPYSVGLFLAGILLAFLPFVPRIALSKELIFTALLPPLLFQAAFDLHWGQVRRNLPVIALLATVGVLLSAGVTAAGMHFLLRWQWIGALAFGVLIAATDPVSVIAIFKEAKAHGRLLVLIESESLLNDGTAAVAFSLVLAFAQGGQPTPTALSALFILLKTVGGGMLCGIAAGYGALLLMGRTDDHLVEVTFTTIAAFGSFLLAEDLGLSGVLATIMAGLVMGNCQSPRVLTQRGKDTIEAFWEYAAFVANSLVFLLIGMHEASQNFMAIWLPALAAIAVVLLGRAVAIYPLCALFSRSQLRVPLKQQHTLFWGGLRGALALALALGLPAGFPLRDEIINVSFAVVAFSIFIQGLTMAPFLRGMGEISRASDPVATGA
ncbi:MAG TPA: sodium:proton antiporter [Terracidiphilus sp.]|jgi:CPA1 family monovalent cation:H+ antiporter